MGSLATVIGLIAGGVLFPASAATTLVATNLASRVKKLGLKYSAASTASSPARFGYIRERLISPNRTRASSMRVDQGMALLSRMQSRN